MGDHVWVDPNHLRNVAPSFDSLVQRVSDSQTKLSGVISGEGECWGADETGTTFSSGYVPRVDVVTSSFEFATGALSSIANRLRAVADNYEQTDQDTANNFGGAL